MAAACTEKRTCVIRPARDQDEAHGLWWPLMQELGWNRASKDIVTHYKVATARSGPSGWLHVARSDEPENADGCIVPFVFDNGTAWIAFFCIKEPLRGRGLGGHLFRACLDHLERSGTRFVGLDAVKEQVGTYSRRGFVEKDIIRLMTRRSTREMPVMDDPANSETKKGSLVPLEDIPGNVLTESDLAITGFERSRLWTQEALFIRDDIFGFALRSEHSTETCQGWLLARQCQHGWRIGPLYAKEKATAKFLLQQAMLRLPDDDGSFIAEVWQSNQDAVSVFEEAGWQWAEINYHRMWLNGAVPEAQQPGGRAEREMFAIFDAAQS